jgi:hypothetical protein
LSGEDVFSCDLFNEEEIANYFYTSFLCVRFMPVNSEALTK